MDNKNGKAFFSMETQQGRVANQLLYPVIVVAIVIILNLFVRGKLLTGTNMTILVANCVTNAFVAWGISYIWSSGADFSSGATLILGANIGGVLAMQYGLNSFGLFGGAIITCVILQLVSTFIRLKLNIPAWVMGLGMCLIYEAFGVMYSTACADKGQQTVTLNSHMGKVIIQMPWIFFLLAAGLIFMMTIYSRTTIGINYQAVSCNTKVAGYMGIKSNKTILFGVTIGAVMLGIAGALQMIYSTRVATASSLGSFGAISKGLCAWLLSSGMDKKMNPPAAILLSAFLIAVVFNFLTRLGVPQGTWLDFILGCSILVFLWVAAKQSKEA